MRWLWLFLIVIMFSGTAQAAYFNDSVIRLGNTSAWITLNQFTFDNFTNFNETDNPTNTIQFYINGSQIRFTSNVNKTLTNPIFNNTTDNLTFQVSGSVGWLNFSTTMINASNSYNLTANGAFVESRNTTADKIVWFNYTGDATLSVTWNASVPAAPPVNGAPAITSYSPASLTPTIDVNALTTFNSGANQSVQWTWTGATEGTGDGTANSSATQTWTTTGTKTVTVTCSNANGSCGTIQWDVTVVSDGSGGGTDWDYLTGTVTPAGSTITINPSVTGSPATGGAYTFGYVFNRTVGTYWVNVSKTGYYPNNTQITFDQDHEVWDVILTEIPIPIPVGSTYWNSLTQDESLYVKPQESQSVTFKLLNSNITSTVWTFDSVTQGETSRNYTQIFNNIGHHNVSAIGTTPDGTTPMILWNILAVRQKSGAGDVTPNLNTSWFDSVLTSISGSSPDFTHFISALLLPFSTPMGSLLYVFLYLIPLVVIWIRQEKSILPVGLGIIFGGLLIGSLPESWQLPLQLFILLTTLGVMYSLFKERG